MKHIHPAIILIIITILCGLMEETKAGNAKMQGIAITNATKTAMPIARKQRIGVNMRHTARAKSGFCFAVKKGKIAYMSKEKATKYGAKAFSLSHEARREAGYYKKP